jgi:hypothetical protein
MNKLAVTIIIGLIFFTVQPISQASPKPREIYIECESLFSSGPYAPLSSLNSALKKNPRVNRFQVVWDASGSLGTFWCEAIYDRKKRILWLQNTSDFLSNEEKDIPERTKSVRRWLFQNVTDQSLRRLAVKYQNKGNDDEASFSFLPHLTEFGCTKKVVKNWSQVYQVPQQHTPSKPPHKR